MPPRSTSAIDAPPSIPSPVSEQIGEDVQP
jgi:hypothetical protein